MQLNKHRFSCSSHYFTAHFQNGKQKIIFLEFIIKSIPSCIMCPNHNIVSKQDDSHYCFTVEESQMRIRNIHMHYANENCWMCQVYWLHSFTLNQFIIISPTLFYLIVFYNISDKTDIGLPNIQCFHLPTEGSVSPFQLVKQSWFNSPQGHMHPRISLDNIWSDTVLISFSRMKSLAN